MKTKKLLTYLGIAAVVLIIFAVVGKKAGWFGGKAKLKIAVEASEKRTITEFITANGRVQPETEVKISPDVSGEIVELHINEGDAVNEGDLLLKIKPDTYLSALDRMKATLNSSKSNLANAKARLAQIKAQFKQNELSYKRNKKLYDQGAISQAEYEQSLSSYEMSKAEVEAAEQNVNAAHFQVKSAEASLSEAQENLTKTTIYAPMPGTVSMLNVEKGERVVGTMQMAGTEMLRIANLNTMEVVVEVNENDIVRVSYGDTAIIEIDAYIDEQFKGVVTEIANSSISQSTTGAVSSTDQVVNFEVKVRILPESYKHLIPKDKPDFFPFRPGMSATVDIQTETRNNVISVPIQAVTTRSDSIGSSTDMQEVNTDEQKEFKKQGQQSPEKDKVEIEEIVFVYKDGKVTERKVKTGIQDSDYIQILEGLEEGEEVVIAPYSAISKRLKDGMEVEKVEKDKLFTVGEKDK